MGIGEGLSVLFELGEASKQRIAFEREAFAFAQEGVAIAERSLQASLELTLLRIDLADDRDAAERTPEGSSRRQGKRSIAGDIRLERRIAMLADDGKSQQTRRHADVSPAFWAVDMHIFRHPELPAAFFADDAPPHVLGPRPAESAATRATRRDITIHDALARFALLDS